MKFIRVIKADNNKKLLQCQKQFLQWLKKYNKLLDQLENLTIKFDDNFDNDEGGFNYVFFDLVAKVTGEKGVPGFLPRVSFDEAYLYCNNFIKEAENILNKQDTKDIKNLGNLKNDFNIFQQKLMSKLKEGEKKGFLDGVGGVYLKDNKVEIIYSTSRRFRHPNEYFDMRYDTPEELQEYNQWEYDFDNIISDFKNKHNIEIDFETYRG